MDVKGAVICFQKYVFGRERTSTCLTPGGPVCLGYMGRVDVQKVHRFKDFLIIASEHDAEYACTRKQLLVYQIDGEFDQSVDIVEFSDSCPNDGRVPFCSGLDRQFFALGCCSVLNISQRLQGRSLRTVASWLNDELKAVRDRIQQKGMKLEFAITGLLGSEDLCLLSLSNHFEAISEVLSEVQKMTHAEGTETVALVDNTHSMLMLDCTGRVCDWGDANAQIFFSTHSKDGISYLTSVYHQLVDTNPDSKNDISFEGCYGEYDAVIRCPARLLRTDFYCGETGALSYDNPAYQNAVYQSQTIVYPFGCGHLTDTGAADREAPPLDTALDDTMERDMKEITRNILGTEEDKYQELTYIRLAFYRLLKDYRRMMAAPFNVCLHSDLTLQFHTAINAIVKASGSRSARQPVGPASMLENDFNTQFDDIINAMNSAMLTTGQVDRFYFNEQPSYLQNTGSYQKVLLAYYGFIKDVLRLLYSVERDMGSRQPMVVPLLSFGLTPIIHSQSFSSYVRRDDGTKVPTRLLCIKLPYQALANPPKYLGILVHEVFHYLEPPRAGSWNKLLVTCLIRISLCEFIGVLATGLSDAGANRNYGSVFYHTYGTLVDAAAQQITEDLFLQEKCLNHADPDNLRNILFRFLDFHRAPYPGTDSYPFYYQIWVNLRKQFISEAVDKVVQKLFALDKTDGLEEAFASRVRAVTDFYPFRNLLSSCYSALAEVTADLFDVGTVLHGKGKDVWAKQFFWQIYSTRSDLLLGCETASPSIDHPEPGLLPANGIRFGIFMDYCLGLTGSGADRTDRFADVLKEWCAGANEKDRFDRVQSTFRGDYRVYSAYDSLYTGHERQFLDVVCAAMESLERYTECTDIIQKISGFYWRYCEIMDGLRQGKKETLKLDESGFDLCIDFIEAYQNQDSIQALTEFSPAVPSPSPRTRAASPALLSAPEHPPRGYAEYPAELSWAVSSACREMSVGGKVPLLWYRGQRNKHSLTLPGTLRSGRQGADGSFLTRFRQELHLARTQILPKGSDFTKAEWLAYLQHNEFPTNVLDFSESFYPALYFAIQRWIDKPEELPECDSHITLLNPVLFNLAMCALDESGKTGAGDCPAMNMLKEYLEHGTIKDGIYLQLPLFSRDEEGAEETYKCYFSWNEAANDTQSPQCPRAALIPKNSERMRQQSGQFVFYDLRTRTERDAKKMSLENLCTEYWEFVETKGLPHIPFLYEINVNRFAHKPFVDYANAIGLRKYHVYPELDKLAKDVKQLVRE